MHSATPTQTTGYLMLFSTLFLNQNKICNRIWNLVYDAFLDRDRTKYVLMSEDFWPENISGLLI